MTLDTIHERWQMASSINQGPTTHETSEGEVLIMSQMSVEHSVEGVNERGATTNE